MSLINVCSEQKPIGYFRGQPIYPILGAEDTPGGQSATDPNAGQSAGQGTGTGTPATPPAPDGQSAEPAVVSRDEFEKLRSQLSAADQRRNEAEQRAKALEDKDKSELERTQAKAQELEQSVQGLQGTVQRLQLENAFLKDSTFTWHDPSDVLRFINDDDSVTMDDKGNVVGMESALKKLAQSKPYLVKKEEAKLPETPSGDASNGSGKSGANVDEAKLRTKYNALRR